uniref:Uncharacterized protein n=1 Tax=Mycena chlorophos TaxID=658473 RepID=A0ABQ0L002_MYCCL|nr:predicted protein [Mycena chlorophos]
MASKLRGVGGCVRTVQSAPLFSKIVIRLSANPSASDSDDISREGVRSTQPSPSKFQFTPDWHNHPLLQLSKRCSKDYCSSAIRALRNLPIFLLSGTSKATTQDRVRTVSFGKLSAHSVKVREKQRWEMWRHRTACAKA